jgi:hypothetical protein
LYDESSGGGLRKLLGKGLLSCSEYLPSDDDTAGPVDQLLRDLAGVAERHANSIGSRSPSDDVVERARLCLGYAKEQVVSARRTARHLARLGTEGGYQSWDYSALAWNIRKKTKLLPPLQRKVLLGEVASLANASYHRLIIPPSFYFRHIVHIW